MSEGERKAKEQKDEKNYSVPKRGFLRIWQIIGGKGFPTLIPVCKSEWWSGVKDGTFPPAIKLSKRVTVWRAEDIWDLIEGR